MQTPNRARRRAHPIGVLLAVILVAFLIGLVYLGQTVHLAATNFRIDRLIGERDDLYRQVQTVETSALHWATEPLVLDRARQLGLEQLTDRIRLPTP